MKISYFKDTDTLYIELNQNQSTYSKEVDENVVLDLDNKNRVTGIEIENASKNFDINSITTHEIPITIC